MLTYRRRQTYAVLRVQGIAKPEFEKFMDEGDWSLTNVIYPARIIESGCYKCFYFF